MNLFSGGRVSPRAPRPRSPPAKPIMPPRKKLDPPPSTSVRRPASPEPIKHVKQTRKHDKASVIYEKDLPAPANDSDSSIKMPKKKQKKRVQNAEGSKKSKKSKV